MNKEKIHFKGINGLRFFSASAVILSHIELIKMAFRYSHFWNHPFFFIWEVLEFIFSLY